MMKGIERDTGKSPGTKEGEYNQSNDWKEENMDWN